MCLCILGYIEMCLCKLGYSELCLCMFRYRQICFATDCTCKTESKKKSKLTAKEIVPFVPSNL